MIPIYQESSDSLQINEIRSAHFPPHLHKSIELIYVTEGSLVMGVGIDLYELHKGDLGIVFPNLIHHYQVFSPGENRHIVLLASPSYFGSYEQILTTFRPARPVIPANELHPDIQPGGQPSHEIPDKRGGREAGARRDIGAIRWQLREAGAIGRGPGFPT